MRASVFVLSAVLVALPLVGCASAPQSKEISATFLNYERKKVGETPAYTIPEGEYGGGAGVYSQREAQPIMEATGRAIVRMADGAELAAECPFQNLKEGQPVTLKQNDDGSWVVLALE